MEQVTTEETMVKPDEQDDEAAQAATTPDEAQAELAELRSALEQRDQEIESLRSRLASATARYREALLAAAPEIPEELVVGESPEEVETSLASARQMVEKVRGQIESQIAGERVPSGAPVRGGQDFSDMSSREKIAHALTQRAQGR